MASYISSSDDDAAASDTTDANKDRLASVMELFRDDKSEFDSSFSGFEAETDDDESEFDSSFSGFEVESDDDENEDE